MGTQPKSTRTLQFGGNIHDPPSGLTETKPTVESARTRGASPTHTCLVETPVASRRGILIRRLTEAKCKTKMAKGAMCDEKFTRKHNCKSRQLQVLIVNEEEEGSEES